MHISLLRPAIFTLLVIATGLIGEPVSAAEKDTSTDIQSVNKKQTIISVKNGKWSHPKTWQPNRVPQTGDQVLVQTGTKVIYDVNSDAIIRSIKVSGDLIFARDRDTLLNVGVLRVQPASGIDGGKDAGVENVNKVPTKKTPEHEHKHSHKHKPANTEALLAIGMPNAAIPAKHTARIRLHFLKSMNKDDEPAIIAIPGGRMEIHGSPMSRTWVKLGADLAKGDTTVTLSSKVTGWRVGDEVIVTASTRAQDGHTFRN